MSFICRKHGYRNIVVTPVSQYPWYPVLWHYSHFTDGKTKTEKEITFILQQCMMPVDYDL